MPSCCEHGIDVSVESAGKNAILTLKGPKGLGERRFEEVAHQVAHALHGNIVELKSTSKVKVAQMKVRLRKINRILRDAQRAIVRALTMNAARRRSQNRRRQRPPKTLRTAPVHFAAGHA